MRIALLFLIPALASFLFFSPLNQSQRKWLSSGIATFLFLIWLPLFWNFETQFLLIGAWPHYAGITWMLDPLSAIFVGVAILLYWPCAWAMSESSKIAIVLFHFLLAALIAAFLTADLFNLFVMFEILLLASYALFFCADKIRAAASFIWVNVFASTLFLFFLAYLYRCTGSLNMVDVMSRFASLSVEDQNLLFVSGSTVFLLKAGLFPLFLWAPHSYASLPTPILAFFAALGSKVGVYAFIRWSSIVGEEVILRHEALLFSLSAVGVFLFALCAFRQDSLKKALVYISLSHTSFILLAVSFFESLSLTGALTYFFIDSFVIAGLFFFMEDYQRSGRPSDIGRRSPFVAIILLLILFASAGFPPFGSFWAKWFIIRDAIEQPALFSLVLLASFSYLAWSAWLWSKVIHAESSDTRKSKFKMSLSSVFCSFAILVGSGIIIQSPYLFSEASNQSLNASYRIRDAMEETQSIETYREIQKELGRF